MLIFVCNTAHGIGVRAYAQRVADSAARTAACAVESTRSFFLEIPCDEKRFICNLLSIALVGTAVLRVCPPGINAAHVAAGPPGRGTRRLCHRCYTTNTLRKKCDINTFYGLFASSVHCDADVHTHRALQAPAFVRMSLSVRAQSHTHVALTVPREHV